MAAAGGEVDEDVVAGLGDGDAEGRPVGPREADGLGVLEDEADRLLPPAGLDQEEGPLLDLRPPDHGDLALPPVVDKEDLSPDREFGEVAGRNVQVALQPVDVDIV